MRTFAYLWRRIAGAFAVADRQALEDRLDDEIRFHVEQQTEKNRRAGMAPDEARRRHPQVHGLEEAGVIEKDHQPQPFPRIPRRHVPHHPEVMAVENPAQDLEPAEDRENDRTPEDGHGREG